MICWKCEAEIRKGAWVRDLPIYISVTLVIFSFIMVDFQPLSVNGETKKRLFLIEVGNLNAVLLESYLNQTLRMPGSY